MIVSRCLQICLSVIFLTEFSYCDLSMTVLPSNSPSIGDELDISCKVDNKIAKIMWEKDEKTIGEDCAMYSREEFLSCEDDGATITIKLKSIRLEDKGRWGCKYGPRARKVVDIKINVPVQVESLKLHTSTLNRAVLTNVDGSTTTRLERSSTSHQQHKSPLGTLHNPIDLTRSTDSLLIECSTSCASVEHRLTLLAVNSTSWDSLELSPDLDRILADQLLRPVITRSLVDTSYSSYIGPSSSTECPPGLQSTRALVEVECGASSGSARLPPVKNRLMGLTRIDCQPLTSPRHRRDYQGNNRRSFIINGQDDCDEGSTTSKCVYLLCPGQPMARFTLGEKSAIAAAIALLIILFCLFICISRRRRSTRRNQQQQWIGGNRHEPVKSDYIRSGPEWDGSELML